MFVSFDRSNLLTQLPFPFNRAKKQERGLPRSEGTDIIFPSMASDGDNVSNRLID